MAEVQEGGQSDRKVWCNALAQPDVKVGDYVLLHANLILAIISDAEAQRMLDAARELEEALDREEAGQSPRRDEGGDRRGTE